MALSSLPLLRQAKPTRSAACRSYRAMASACGAPEVWLACGWSKRRHCNSAWAYCDARLAFVTILGPSIAANADRRRCRPLSSFKAPRVKSAPSHHGSQVNSADAPHPGLRAASSQMISCNRGTHGVMMMPWVSTTIATRSSELASASRQVASHTTSAETGRVPLVLMPSLNFQNAGQAQAAQAVTHPVCAVYKQKARTVRSKLRLRHYAITGLKVKKNGHHITA